MWCPEGYVLLSEVVGQFLWDSDLAPLAEDRPRPDVRFHIDDGMLSRNELDAWRNWLAVCFFRTFREDLRACLPSGAVVRLGGPVFGWTPDLDGLDFNPFPHVFPNGYLGRIRLCNMMWNNIDLSAGCIGAGEMLRDQELSPIALSPICIKDSALPVRLEDLTRWLMEETAKRGGQTVEEPDGPDNDLAHQIARAFDNGRFRTKAEARALFDRRREMKTEVWQAVWKEARTLRPDLGKPGPRANNSKQHSE